MIIIACLLVSSPIVTANAGTAPAAPLTRFSYTQYHMGVDARLVVYAPDLAVAEKACIAAFARIAALDTIMSDYRRDSELNRLCEKAGGPPVKVSPDLFLVLQRSQEVSKRSDGAFDVTAGPLIRLWRAARKSGTLPDAKAIAAARKLTGWKKLRLDQRDRTVRLMVKGMQLDLGGIAKGYADDEAQRVLKAHGIRHALVEMGGDLVMTEPPPGAEGWKIRVPNAGDDAGPADLFYANCAVSTSGDTEQFAVLEGTRYSHVVDPRTGQALTSRVQVTISAPDGLTTDPLSTALTLLNPEQRQRLLKHYPGTKAFVRVLPLTGENAPPTPSRFPGNPPGDGKPIEQEARTAR